jgi:hypothetical protein
VKQEDSVAVHAKPVMSKGHAMGQIGGHGQWAYRSTNTHGACVFGKQSWDWCCGREA